MFIKFSQFLKEPFVFANINWLRPNQADYVAFDPADYIDNPVALARIKAGITQEELARRMKVTQAYISKIEAQGKVSPKVLQKVKHSLEKY